MPKVFKNLHKIELLSIFLIAIGLTLKIQNLSQAILILLAPFALLGISYFMIAVYAEVNKEGAVHRFMFKLRFLLMTIALNAILFTLMNYTGGELMIKVSAIGLIIILGYDIINRIGTSVPTNRNNLVRTIVFLAILLALLLTPQEGINKTLNNTKHKAKVSYH
ncbi:MAG TPA: hypothetical protein VJ939_04315 [Bacteroidales bacterium]|nr:hypothetical protein [Bacteroidales bacterium]